MSKQMLAIILILALVAMVACTPTQVAKTAPATQQEAAVDQDIGAVSEVENELDTSSMDSMDQDLAEITW